jgi:HSP20 family protein
MPIIRWNPSSVSPARDPFAVRDEFDRLFENFFSRATLRNDVAPLFTPAIDIEETAEEFLVRADLPGVAQKDVKVSLMGDTLTIRGERRQDASRAEGNLHRIERVHGSFERSFTLGTPVRNDGVKASYRDGVLEIHVPKAEEAKLREIEIQVAS